MGKIKLKNLYIDVERTLAGEFLLVDKPKIFYYYENGVRKEKAGLEYTCLSEGLNYDKQAIKVYGSIVPQIEYEGKPIRVMFEGLEGKVWEDYNTKEIKLSVTAKNIISGMQKTRLKMNVEDKA